MTVPRGAFRLAFTVTGEIKGTTVEPLHNGHLGDRTEKVAVAEMDKVEPPSRNVLKKYSGVRPLQRTCTYVMRVSLSRGSCSTDDHLF